MPNSKRMRKYVRNHFRQRATIERRSEKEIKESCEQYHAWCDAQKQQRNKPLTIIAEGDSWFRYVVGKAVIYQLERLMKIQIQNLASPGDEVQEMLAPTQLMRLATLLKRGPTRGWKYDCLLFSGGGNDLVGKDRFHKWLHPYQPGMQLQDIINQTTLGAELTLIEAMYEELIELRDNNSPNTHLFFHSYDFAIPDGRGVCWRGPWVEPGLVLRKVPKTKRRAVVKLFLQQFDQMLSELASRHDRVTLVPTQGTLDDNNWDNELHPTNAGFKKIARVFQAAIEHQYSI